MTQQPEFLDEFELELEFELEFELELELLDEFELELLDELELELLDEFELELLDELELELLDEFELELPAKAVPGAASPNVSATPNVLAPTAARFQVLEVYPMVAFLRSIGDDSTFRWHDEMWIS
jgi:hypothetical protein